MKTADMNIDIDSVIDIIGALRGLDHEYYHNALGINNDKASWLMGVAEDIIYDYLEAEDDDWEAEDILEDILLSCKFHQLSATESIFFICYGYNYLSTHLDGIDLFSIDPPRVNGIGRIIMDLN